MKKKGKTKIQIFVSKKVKELREENNLTQEEFSERIKCSRSSFAGRENVNSDEAFNLEAINTIAKEFKVSPQYFIPKEAL